MVRYPTIDYNYVKKGTYLNIVGGLFFTFFIDYQVVTFDVFLPFGQ